MSGELTKHRHSAKVIGNEMHGTVKFGHASRFRTIGRTHLRDQEAAVLRRQEVVRDTGFNSFSGEQKPRAFRGREIEEEDPVLAL